MTQEVAASAAGHGPHETSIEIVVNGTPHVVHDKKLPYEQVVDLAYDGNPPTGPNVMIVVTYARGQSSQKGTLVRGQEVPVHKGMVFNVYDATES
jgi:hypothetical protein